MDQTAALLDLPVETLVALASGYLGYRLAFAGRAKGHQAIDTVFLVLVFAAIAKWAAQLLPGNDLSRALKGGCIAIATAFAWVLALRYAVRRLLSELRLNESDTLPTLWQSINANPAADNVVRIVVRLTDGSALISEKMYRFRNAPMKAWMAGEDGSIAMHVTGARARPEEEWEDIEPPGGGHFDLTYIPAHRIAEVELTIQD